MIYEWLAQRKGAIFNFRKWQRRFLFRISVYVTSKYQHLCS